MLTCHGRGRRFCTLRLIGVCECVTVGAEARGDNLQGAQVIRSDAQPAAGHQMERQPQCQGSCAQGAPQLCLFREGETALQLHSAHAVSGRKEILILSGIACGEA